VAYLGLYGSILLNNILPIFIAAGAGYGLGRALRPDIRTISRLAFYVFSPSLVFSSIVHSQLSGGDFSVMAAFTLVLTGIMAVLALGAGRAMRLERHALAALIVAAVFGNTGNYGLAVVKFAFGDSAVAFAVIVFVFSTLAVYSLGVGVASLGRRSLRQVLLHGLTLPTTYALAAGLVLRFTGWPVALPVDRALTLLGQAAIPVMLVLLGLQIAEIREVPRSRLALIGLATFMQLIVAPLVGLGLAAALGMDGPARQAAVTEAAMPTAVITTILGVEYDLDMLLLSGTVVLSTALSPLTLTPLIAFLQR
jgi:predicted permease